MHVYINCQSVEPTFLLEMIIFLLEMIN